MNKIFKKIGMWFTTTFLSIMYRISISLKNVEDEILKADPDDLDDKKKQEQKVRHRNPLAQKLLDGQRDEQFVKDYYEILKKADHFMKTATPSQMQVAAEKWGMTYGKTDEEVRNVGRVANSTPKKDRWGKRYEHFGFFDPKSKHYGKTLAEVLEAEKNERRTNDDDYEVEFMFTNKYPEQGFTGIDLVEIKYIKAKNLDGVAGLDKVIKKKFPLDVVRDKDVVNKIEELTEYVHVKRITEEVKLIEFFIPAKFKLFDYAEDSNLFKEIIDIKQVWMYDEWKQYYSYSIKNYVKRLVVKNRAGEDVYHVIKFNAYKMQELK